MPWAKIGFDAGGERGFLDAFVNLEEMRMAFPDADPDDFRWTFRRKCSDAFDGEKKSAELDGA